MLKPVRSRAWGGALPGGMTTPNQVPGMVGNQMPGMNGGGVLGVNAAPNNMPPLLNNNGALGSGPTSMPPLPNNNGALGSSYMFSGTSVPQVPPMVMPQGAAMGGAIQQSAPLLTGIAAPTPAIQAQSPIGVAGEMPAYARGGVPNLAAGGFNVSMSPHLSGSWQERSAAHSLTRGPILSAVPGRTDAHATHVPSGSYVIPADIVSGRGQGNTIAGANVLQRLFKMGPYGSGMPSMVHGSPHVGSIKALSEGGAPDSDDTTEPVRVNLAGGEIVVPPENLKLAVHPDLKTAHEIMDAWVLNERKNLRKTLAKLPGPVKD